MKQRTPRGFWDIKENVIVEAKKYDNRTKFHKGSVGAYESALRNGWINEVCEHMNQTMKVRFFWHNKENVIAEARKYNNRSDFIQKSNGAYEAAIRHGWVDEIFNDILPSLILRDYWNKETVCTEALKYNTRTEFCKGSAGAYDSAFTNGWLDEACSHMAVQGNLARRFLYKITFTDGAIYIGLTCNPKKRFLEHIKRDCTVSRYITKTNLEPTFELLNENLYSAEDAADLEAFIIDEYRSMGKNIINKMRGGSLGGVYK